MSEYKLSITAKEIDERLGQIPQLALDIENLKQNGGVVVEGSVDYSEPIYENGRTKLCTLNFPGYDRLTPVFIEDYNPETLLVLGETYSTSPLPTSIEVCKPGMNGAPALGNFDILLNLSGDRSDSFYCERFGNGWLCYFDSISIGGHSCDIYKYDKMINPSRLPFVNSQYNDPSVMTSHNQTNTNVTTEKGSYIYQSDDTNWVFQSSVFYDDYSINKHYSLRIGDIAHETKGYDFRNQNVRIPFGTQDRILIGYGNMSILGCGPDTGESACGVILDVPVQTGAADPLKYKTVMFRVADENVEKLTEFICIDKIKSSYTIDKNYIQLDYNDLNHVPVAETEALLPLYSALALVFTDYSDEYQHYIHVDNVTNIIQPNYSYIIGWDERTYFCCAYDISDIIPGAIAIGNLEKFGIASNNEPFLIIQTDTNLTFVSTIPDTWDNLLHSVSIAKKGRYKQTLPLRLNGLMQEQAIKKTICDNYMYFEFDTFSEYFRPVVITDEYGTPTTTRLETSDICQSILDSLQENKYYKIIWQNNEYICQMKTYTIKFRYKSGDLEYATAKYFMLGDANRLLNTQGATTELFRQVRYDIEKNDNIEFPFCLYNSGIYDENGNLVGTLGSELAIFVADCTNRDTENGFNDSLQIYELEDPKIDSKYLDLGDVNLNLDILTDGDEAIEEVILPMTEIVAKGDSVIDPSEPPVLQNYFFGKVMSDYFPPESEAILADLSNKLEFGTEYTITLNDTVYKCKYEDITSLVRAGFNSSDPEEMAMVDYLYGGILSPSDFMSAMSGGLAEGDFGYVHVWLDMPDYDYVETMMNGFMFGVTSHGEDIPMQIGISKITPGGEQHIKYKYLDFIAGGGEENVELFPLQTVHAYVEYTDDVNNTARYCAQLNKLQVIMGQPYDVSFRGSKYTCIAQDITPILFVGGEDSGTPADAKAYLLGNFFATNDISKIPADELAFFESLGLIDTGEPFLVEIVDVPSMGLGISMVAFKDILNEDGIDIELGITGTATIKPYIKHEFLDFMNNGSEGHEGQTISPKLTNTLYQASSNENGYFYMGTMMGMDSSLPVAGNLEPDMKCKVDIEGQESVIVQAKDVADLAVILMPGMTFTKAVAIGNIALFAEAEPAMGELITVENTGEDWGFGVFEGVDEDGTAGWGMMIIVRTPTDEGSSIEFTASVTEWVEGGQSKIKEEFLPDITWNSIAGYKQIIPETTITIESDEAIFESNGEASQLTIGEMYDVTIDDVTYQMPCVQAEFFLALHSEDAPYLFVHDSAGIIFGSPCWLVIVQEYPYPTPENPKTITVSVSQGTLNKIPSYLLPSSSTGLPEVSSADAGKFLRVNTNGDWVAMAIPNAEEVSF